MNKRKTSNKQTYNTDREAGRGTERGGGLALRDGKAAAAAAAAGIEKNI